MDFDLVLEEIGEFGRYQQTNYLLICLPVMFAAANSLSYVFTAGIPNYRCFVPECDKSIEETDYDQSWVHSAVPGTIDSDGVFIPEQCEKYIIEDWNATVEQCPLTQFTSKKEKCSKWVYDKFERTIVIDWDITCAENQWKLALVGTIHFAGLVAGTASSGILADRFGRKLVFIICIVFMSVTGVLQGFAWNYGSFLFWAFMNAVGTSGVYPLAFIIGVEMVGPTKREMSGIVLNYFYAVGEAAVGLLAWACRDWQILQFALSAPPLLFALYYWAVPESVRWLLAKNEHQKACFIIKKAARINGKELSEAMLASFEKTENYNSDSGDETRVNREMYLKQSQKKSEMLQTFKQAITSKILLIRFALLLYIWIANAIVYYGLSLNSTNLSGNKYLNFALVCLIEIPGYTLSWFLMNKFGRRWSLAGSFFLCGITCAAGGFVTDGLTWAVVTLFLIGKLGITSSFAIIYCYTAEMMPTIIRSGGVGALSTAARFGAMLAPFVPLLGTYYKALPLLSFGAAAILGSIFSLMLPETFRRKLPDTVEESEQLGKWKRPKNHS